MARAKPSSPRALRALDLVESLQGSLVARLSEVARARSTDSAPFRPIEWLRDEGRHGGGTRYSAAETAFFNRASVNISCVHYDDQPERKLGSATALSTIIHPRNPRAPSLHMHISWTELKRGVGYWRIMADLNPAIPDDDQTRAFDSALERAAGPLYGDGCEQGRAYFFIPALDRHRGVAHFYLEGYASDDFEADHDLAERMGRTVIECYGDLVASAAYAHPEPDAADFDRQLHYHSVYLLQVLTLDRGTTSGLLVHDQNDVGILGSLPSHVDRGRLRKWIDRMPAPQDQLLSAIVDVLPDQHPCPVSDQTRQALADAVRAHYRAHPEALDMQASGGITPPTVDNHSR